MEEEMKDLVENSPDMRLLFLSQNTKVALTRFCTWIMSVINNLDEGDESDFIFAVPVLFIDIPFPTKPDRLTKPDRPTDQLTD